MSAYSIWRENMALFGRYHCGMPQGLMAGYAAGESGGHMVCAGDDPAGETSCGGQGSPLYEYGFFQITRSQETRFGVPAGFRKTIDGNFWLAGAEQNVECALAARKYGVAAGSQESWLLAFLVFEIGAGGTALVWRAAQAAGYRGYAGLVEWSRTSAVFPISGPSGTMTVDKIVRRIQRPVIVWAEALRVGLPMAHGAPFMVPAPGGVAFKVPDAAQGLIEVGKVRLGTEDIAVGVLSAVLAKVVGIV